MGWMVIIGHRSSKRTFDDNNLLQAGTGCTTANLTYLEEQQTFEAEWPQASLQVFTVSSTSLHRQLPR